MFSIKDSQSLSPHLIKKFADRLDGVETRSRVRLPVRSEKLDEMVGQLGLAAIGSSDSHRLQHVGVAVTEIYGPLDGFKYKSDAILEAIRQGRTKAVSLRPGEHSHESAVSSFLRRSNSGSSKKHQKAA